MFTLQTIPAWEDDDRFARLAKVPGFSLHARSRLKPGNRRGWPRYISRPAVSEKRLSPPPSGNIRYQLKTPYNDGTTHLIFDPLGKYRVDVPPANRGKGRARQENEKMRTPPEQRDRAMTWTQRLKRVFNIDVSICEKRGGGAMVIACIEDRGH